MFHSISYVTEQCIAGRSRKTARFIFTIYTRMFYALCCWGVVYVFMRPFPSRFHSIISQ